MSANISEASSTSRQLLSESPNMDEADRQQAICDYIQTRILPELEDDTVASPIELVAHTVRAMIKPTPLLAEIPQLLTYLGHVEYVRCVFMRHLRKMKRLDHQIRANKGKVRVDPRNSYPPDEVEDIPLTRAERDYIEGILNKDAETRLAYRRVVSEFSLLHAWETWCSPKHAELDAVLKIYFPLESLWGAEVAGIEDQYLFHQGLNGSERYALLQAAGSLLMLLSKYGKEKKIKLAPKPSSEAFRTRYALELDIDELVETTMRYVNEVQENIARVESILEEEA
ncbi:hypothetical protein BDY19DRAFT_937997 [Irpex rosettiformis]|uniref:Uncharacterized protein n=1 Tax=Irpex rosettiformis TaxID=378272 RepID=A0ACB8UA73_9APHY|nr:hypothetical protein BDY19DRAFT_937997 [Irpex rosettiformis]